MEKIKNHYEEMKANEKLMFKNIDDLKELVEHHKACNDELREINRNLYRENKETKLGSCF